MSSGMEDHHFADQSLTIYNTTIMRSTEVIPFQTPINEPPEAVMPKTIKSAEIKVQLADQKIHDLAADLKRKTGDITLYSKYIYVHLESFKC